MGDSTDFKFDNVQIHYLTDTKSKVGTFGSTKNIHGTLFIKPDNQTERFLSISNWAYEVIRDCDQILIEGYSMGSKGAVFHIAENTGLLKYQMHIANLKWSDLAPTSLKKFASGKGNSKKEQMYEAFFNETQINLRSIFNIKSEKVGSPVSDIVDSFYLAKYLSAHPL